MSGDKVDTTNCCRRQPRVDTRLPMSGKRMASFWVMVSVGGAALMLRQAPARMASVAVATIATEAGTSTHSGRTATTSRAACSRGAGGGASYSSVSPTTRRPNCRPPALPSCGALLVAAASEPAARRVTGAMADAPWLH